MAMYRVRRKLALGGGKYLPRGLRSELQELKPEVLRKLIELGYIDEVETPPLGILPRFKSRAARLEAVGVRTIEHLIRANAEQLAQQLNLEVTTVKRWQKEAEAYL